MGAVGVRSDIPVDDWTDTADLLPTPSLTFGEPTGNFTGFADHGGNAHLRKMSEAEAERYRQEEANLRRMLASRDEVEREEAEGRVERGFTQAEDGRRDTDPRDEDERDKENQRRLGLELNDDDTLPAAELDLASGATVYR